MRKALLVLVMCFCASAYAGGVPSTQPTLSMGAFSIRRLEGCQTLVMLLPMSDGFAPNVNVQIQPYPGTLDYYIALSRQQCRKAGFTVISAAKKGKSSWVIEYRGAAGGPNLHWYSKAELRGKNAYPATATALESQWPSLSGKLKACVDSLQVGS